MHFVTWCYLALMRKTNYKNELLYEKKMKKKKNIVRNNTIHTNIYTVYVSRATLPRVSSTAKNERQIPYDQILLSLIIAFSNFSF